MNIKNMSISLDWTKLSVTYDCGIIVRAEIDKTTGVITFYHQNGQVFSQNITQHIVPEVVYLQQFGVCITKDGKYFFIQSWEKGLFCFEVQTGILVWHCKVKKAYEVVVRSTTVVCHFFEQSICVLDIFTGAVQNRIPLGCGSDFWELTDDLYLIGPKRQMYQIIDSNLNSIVKIPSVILNPHKYENFIILQANISPGGICISGFEHPRAVGYAQKTEESSFSRDISVNIHSIGSP